MTGTGRTQLSDGRAGPGWPRILIGTVKRNGLDPEAYLSDVLERMLAGRFVDEWRALLEATVSRNNAPHEHEVALASILSTGEFDPERTFANCE